MVLAGVTGTAAFGAGAEMSITALLTCLVPQPDGAWSSPSPLELVKFKLVFLTSESQRTAKLATTILKPKPKCTTLLPPHSISQSQSQGQPKLKGREEGVTYMFENGKNFWQSFLEIIFHIYLSLQSNLIPLYPSYTGCLHLSNRC